MAGAARGRGARRRRRPRSRRSCDARVEPRTLRPPRRAARQRAAAEPRPRPALPATRRPARRLTRGRRMTATGSVYLGVGPIAAIAARRRAHAPARADHRLQLHLRVPGAHDRRRRARRPRRRRRDRARARALSLDFFLTRPYLRLAIHGQGRRDRLPGPHRCAACSRPRSARRAGERLAGEPRGSGCCTAGAARGRLGGSRRLGPAADRRRGTRSVPARRDRRPRRSGKAARARGRAPGTPRPLRLRLRIPRRSPRRRSAGTGARAPPCPPRACACRSSRPRARSAGSTSGATGGPPGTTRDGPWPRWWGRCRC